MSFGYGWWRFVNDRREMWRYVILNRWPNTPNNYAVNTATISIPNVIIERLSFHFIEWNAEFSVSYSVRKPTGNKLMEYISKMHRNNMIITEYYVEMASCISFFLFVTSRTSYEWICLVESTNIYRMPESRYKSEMYFLRSTVQTLLKGDFAPCST
jgi:hypothetical protein